MNFKIDVTKDSGHWTIRLRCPMTNKVIFTDLRPFGTLDVAMDAAKRYRFKRPSKQWAKRVGP